MTVRTKIITGIDIGPSKTRVLIGEAEPVFGNINILGFSEKNSRGIINGKIVNLHEECEVIKAAIKDAEEQSRHTVVPENLYISVSGNQIESVNRKSSVFIPDNKNIEKVHVEKLLKTSQNQLLAEENTVLNIINNFFIIDGKYHLSDPIGHSGNTLEVQNHIIYANKQIAQIYHELIKNAGYKYYNPVFRGLAVSMGVLSTDDFEPGTLVINIGSSTTEFLVFNNFEILMSKVLSIGINDNINNSDAAEAEKLEENILKQIFIKIFLQLSQAELIDNISKIILCNPSMNISNVDKLTQSISDIPLRKGTSIENIYGPECIINSENFIPVIGLLRYGVNDN